MVDSTGEPVVGSVNVDWSDEVEAVDTSLYLTGGSGGATLPVHRRMDRTTKVLLVILIWGIGFLAGSRIQTVVTSVTTQATEVGAGGPASTEPGRDPQAGDPPTPRVPADGQTTTLGTVKAVDGDTLYLVDAQGMTLKVLTSSATAVSSPTPAGFGDIRPGAAVVVQGLPLPDGTIAARSLASVGR